MFFPLGPTLSQGPQERGEGGGGSAFPSETRGTGEGEGGGGGLTVFWMRGGAWFVLWEERGPEEEGEGKEEGDDLLSKRGCWEFVDRGWMESTRILYAWGG